MGNVGLLVLALAIVTVVVFLLNAYHAKQAEKRFMNSLYEDCGRLAQKEYAPERFARIGSYFLRHSSPLQLDDITWNDLGMDEIFMRMNYTLSASGEEYLYYTLRTLQKEEGELLHLEEVVRFFGDHPDERVKVQLQMNKLGYTGKFSLYDYLDNLDYLGERSNRKSLIQDLLFIPLIALLWVNFSIGVMGLVMLMVYNITTYFKEKGEIDPYITSFAYIMRLLDVCDELEKIKLPVCGKEQERLRMHRKEMQAMRRNSFWVMDPGRGQASGNILEAILDYVRMVFHVDLLKFNSMLKHLRNHIEDVDALIGTAGYLETAIAIGIFRNSLTEGYCLPEFADRNGICMENGYHPLIAQPVKNGIHTEQGVLLTGSNASGKSTFLKTVAVNAVFAQTIHTCMADRFQSSLYQVYSSMALRDDLGAGESYYIVEIKALKRILDAAKEGKRVLCFVDEVLRGTNTVERIAASTQILKSLRGENILCFAATHDIELTELLQKEYDNYHFSEEVRDGDVVFDYKLQSGKATTRNAIRLLELLGYDRKIIEKANEQAEHFTDSGSWI
jgi:Mismatch repair ATPase (MutS family)